MFHLGIMPLVASPGLRARVSPASRQNQEGSSPKLAQSGRWTALLHRGLAEHRGKGRLPWAMPRVGQEHPPARNQEVGKAWGTRSMVTRRDGREAPQGSGGAQKRAGGLKKLPDLREGCGPWLPTGPLCPALRPRWVALASGRTVPLGRLRVHTSAASVTAPGTSRDAGRFAWGSGSPPSARITPSNAQRAAPRHKGGEIAGGTGPRGRAFGRGERRHGSRHATTAARRRL